MAKPSNHVGVPRRAFIRARFAGFWAAVLVALAAAFVAPAATFTASLDRNQIVLGESVTLALTFSGGNPQDVPNPPDIPNLDIAYIGPSSQFSLIQGRVSSIVTHNFQVTPRQAGDYTIPALRATVGGQLLSTQPLTLRVLKPSAPTPEAMASGSQVAFLRLVVPKTEIFVGETVPVQLQLCLRREVQGISNFQLTSLPAEGFLVGKMVQGQRGQAQIGNALYSVIPLLLPVKALSAGNLTLGPATASALLEVPSANRRRDPFFERFGFPDLLGGTEQKQVVLASEAVPLQTLPLPAQNRPANFNGAVGTFTLSLTASPTNLTAGDPITVKVQISGRGALDTLTLPEPSWAGFKVYPATSKLDTTDALGLEGTKYFEQVVVPETASVQALPSFTFSFFDPEQKVYRTLSHPPVPLLVRPGGSASVPALAADRHAGQNQSPAQDIVHIKQRIGAVGQLQPLVFRPWFLGLQALPVLAFLGAAVWRRRTEQLANNPRLRRQRHVARIIRDGLAELRRFAAANDSEAFFATVVRLLQERLGERLDAPASAITEAVIEEKLRPRGVPEELLTPLHDLFQLCNQVRYAPLKTSQELSALIPQIESLLARLEEVKP
ncbi:MAG TPA: BatD family protein [Candidatus Paceibacterota bacterium]|jgi:hypothetical protein|nr:BatD family protein [Candidatus Paceibacterota bacterium]